MNDSSHLTLVKVWPSINTEARRLRLMSAGSRPGAVPLKGILRRVSLVGPSNFRLESLPQIVQSQTFAGPTGGNGPERGAELSGTSQP